MVNSARFATVINCMDGRTQLPVIDYMKAKFDVDYVDVITEPGPVKVITEPGNAFQVYSIQQRMLLSQERHGSQHLGLVAHFDCAANPVEKSRQIEQLRQALSYVSLWGFKGSAVGLWVDENWEVQQVRFDL